jgi:Flp pilus assembly pilin Flp
MDSLSLAGPEINPQPLKLPRCLQIHLERRDSSMLHHFIETKEALKRLRTDQDGVVSFEYIIVAVCIVGAVGAVFGGGAGGQIGAALTTGITAITTAFATAIAG